MDQSTSFLELTARDLYQRFGAHLPDQAVVFPNNRARLFFSEHLYKVAGKPVWSPAFLTISDLFKSCSDLQLLDDLSVTGLLHEIYLQVSGKDESFDEFFHWGEILLGDFDDVDKNMADATQLFRNIREQAEFTDTLEHLTTEQVETIRLFFKHFDPDRKTELKRRFLENWNILLEVYDGLHNRLLAAGKAYEGMLHRQVAERFRREGPDSLPYETYAFVGFNVLNECEKSLFSSLQKAGKALFYWDYDTFYLQDSRHEAGRFMRQNLEKFPNSLEKTLFNVFEKPKQLHFISTSTENAGARYLPEWIRDRMKDSGFKPEETAVVLCNENLLLPVLHSIPDEISELNVTMGFPLSQTPICNLANHVAALHADGFQEGKTPCYNHRYVLPILQHPLIRQFSPTADETERNLRQANRFRPTVAELSTDNLLATLFAPVRNPAALSDTLLNVFSLLKPEDTEDSDAYDPLHAEALFRCHNLLTRLKGMLEENLGELSLQTYRKLVQQVLSRATVPFSGEPVRGLQIMGLLETRNLDFRNVLMLSVNEGMLPKGASDTSFIPYNLRKAFGLTTMEHKDSVYAYYFYRLLQRAEHVSLVYNTTSEGLNRGEMSRFMLQLLMESGHPVERINLTSGIELTTPRSLSVPKTGEIMQLLRERYDRKTNPEASRLSPTALNAFLDCPLRFYLHYLAGLQSPEDVTDEIDSATLGNFFHHAAEFIYTTILLRKAGRPSDTPHVLEVIRNRSLNSELAQHKLRGMIDAGDLKPWLSGVHSLQEVVDLFFRIDFFRIDENAPQPDYNGEQLVRRNLITGFLRTLLKMDVEYAPFEILGLEVPVSGEISPDENTLVRTGGTIDRLDRKEGTVRILDYKTGGNPKKAASLNDLFEPSANRASHLFQIFLYAGILQEARPDTDIRPELLYIHKAASPDYSGVIELGSRNTKISVLTFKPLEEDFRRKMLELTSRLFDNNTPFCQTDIVEKCAYCDYKNICRRA